MGSFYQNGIVANLHDFSYGTSSDCLLYTSDAADE